MTEKKIENLKGKLIVSCQALPHEPLHSSFIMGRMALAAKEGGACGIRANTKEDIMEIGHNVDLPVIGIVKRDYENCKVYITPTMKEVDELMEVKPEIIALDATGRHFTPMSLDSILSEQRWWAIPRRARATGLRRTISGSCGRLSRKRNIKSSQRGI